jgi:hypothetical protein
VGQFLFWKQVLLTDSSDADSEVGIVIPEIVLRLMISFELFLSESLNAAVLTPIDRLRIMFLKHGTFTD